jgi:ribosomal protein S18 acetylase RimI-like enzyme
MERFALTDVDGVVGRYDRDERDGHVYADLFDREPGVTVDRAVRAVLAELGGMRIAADEELGRALVDAGGMLRRHGHLMSHDLAQRPTWRDPPGYRLTDVDRPATDLLDAYRAAFPPGHVDHRDEPPEKSLADLESHVSGREFGPLLKGSGLAIAPDDTVAGAILLGVLPGDPPLNGPWLIEVFRHPDHRGVGRALVERALAIIDAPVLGLIVTEGNPARGLYEALGFRLVSTRMVVEL